MIIVLSLGTLFVISIPSVQTHLANRLTQKINQNFETDIEVEGVTIGFDGAVNLASFFVADHHSDTLFFAKNFKTDLYSLGQWVNGNLFFSSTEFEDIFLKITKYEGEENNSLFQFTYKLLAHSKPQTNRPVFVRIDELTITDGRFLMVDNNSSFKPLAFEKINLQANNFYVVNDGVEVALKNLNFDSREKVNDNEFLKKEIKNWTRVEVLKDYRFYIICLNMLAMPWIATGVFVYQSFITESKEWGTFVIAQSFMVYSILSVVTLLISGFLIDRFTSRKLLIFMNLPLMFSVIVLFYFNSTVSAFVFLGLIGISNGFANVLGSSTWAEIYGVKYIGSIKALTTALMVFSTAFGTALFGLLIDKGFSIEDIALVSLVYMSTSLILLFFVKNKLNPQYI